MGGTDRLTADEAGIARAAKLLRQGRTVAFPTETVYGLGADATNATAVAGVFSAKDRPVFNPLIAHVATIEAAEALVSLPTAGQSLARAFWPGPLTLVAPRVGRVADLVTAGLETLGVRVPAHPVAQALLRQVDRPVAAPSANPSGRISPTTADHVIDGLAGRIAAVLDGGRCEVGVESTIVGFDGNKPVLLRPGGVTREQLESVCGQLRFPQADAAITAPGQMESHYAPAARVRLGVVEAPVIGFGPVKGTFSLSDQGSLAEAAARLFAVLREADAHVAPGAEISVAPIPDHELGAAINDRLMRAAAPRPV